MTATMNGKPRKQLSDELSRLEAQLDRHDTILDALSEGLTGAVKDAATDGTRLAVKDAVVEILTDPALRAALHAASAPPARAEGGRSAWDRLKAKVRAAADKAKETDGERRGRDPGPGRRRPGRRRPGSGRRPGWPGGCKTVALVAVGVGAVGGRGGVRGRPRGGRRPERGRGHGHRRRRPGRPVGPPGGQAVGPGVSARRPGLSGESVVGRPVTRGSAASQPRVREGLSFQARHRASAESDSVARRAAVEASRCPCGPSPAPDTRSPGSASKPRPWGWLPTAAGVVSPRRRTRRSVDREHSFRRTASPERFRAARKFSFSPPANAMRIVPGRIDGEEPGASGRAPSPGRRPRALLEKDLPMSFFDMPGGASAAVRRQAHADWAASSRPGRHRPDRVRPRGPVRPPGGLGHRGRPPRRLRLQPVLQ